MTMTSRPPVAEDGSPHTRRGRMWLSIVAVSVVAAVVTVFAYTALQRAVITSDDFQRGERMGEILTRETDPPALKEGRMVARCVSAVRALYDPTFGYGAQSRGADAMAFFEGCSGVSYGD